MRGSRVNTSPLHIIIVLFLACALFFIPVSAFSGSGAGTQGDPYQITTWQQWNEIDSSLTASYKLMNDIDFSGESYDTGISQGSFAGTLYGNNKTISNVVIAATGTTATDVGLFGIITAGSSGEGIQDLVVKNVDVSSSHTPDVNLHAGIIAGTSAPYSTEYTLRNVYVDADCSISYTGGNFNGNNFGGLVGYSANGRVASNCFSQASINTGTSDDAAYSSVAGILGRITGTSKSICEYTGYAGVITTEFTEKEGIVGEPTDAKSSTATDSFWDTEVSTAVHSPAGTGKTTAQMLTQSTYTNWNFAGIWEMSSAISEWNGYPVFDFMYAPPPPVADFEGVPLLGASPLIVDFTDLSTGTPTSWNWTFGDGAYATIQNASHTFTTSTSRYYNISLTATNDGGSDELIRNNYIFVYASPVANFTYTPHLGTTATTFTFTDISTNAPTAWTWSFGDGSVSYLQNPTHTYAGFGTYDLSLTVTNPSGTSTMWVLGGIEITGPYIANATIDFDEESYLKGDSVEVSWDYEIDPGLYDVVHIFVYDEQDAFVDYYKTIYHYQFANDGSSISNSTEFTTIIDSNMGGNLSRTFDMVAVIAGEIPNSTALVLLDTALANSTFDFPEITNYYSRSLLYTTESARLYYNMGSLYDGIDRTLYPHVIVSLWSGGVRLEYEELPIGVNVIGEHTFAEVLLADTSYSVLLSLTDDTFTEMVHMGAFYFDVEDPIVAGTINWFTDSGEVRTTGTVDETINFGLDTGNPGVYHGYRNIGVLLYWYNTASKQWEQEPSSYVNWIESESRSDIDNEHGYDYVVGRIYGSGTFKPLKEGKYKLLLYGKQTALTEAETIATSPELNVDENYLSPGWIISTGDEIFGLGTTGSAAGGGFGWLMGGIICIIMVFLPVVVFRRVDGIVTLIMFGLGVIISTALNLFPLWIIFVLALIGVLYVLWGGIGQGSLGRGGGGEAKIGQVGDVVNKGAEGEGSFISSGKTIAYFDSEGQLASKTLLPGGGTYTTKFPVFGKQNKIGNGGLNKDDKNQEM